MDKDDTATNQADRDERGRFINGNTPKTSFRDRPQDRSDGRWNSKMSFSYQYKKFLSMSVAEFEKWESDNDKKKRTVVEELVYRRTKEARTSLKDVKEITDRVDGRPQTIITKEEPGEKFPFIKGFALKRSQGEIYSDGFVDY